MIRAFACKGDFARQSRIEVAFTETAVKPPTVDRRATRARGGDDGRDADLPVGDMIPEALPYARHRGAQASRRRRAVNRAAIFVAVPLGGFCVFGPAAVAAQSNLLWWAFLAATLALVVAVYLAPAILAYSVGHRNREAIGALTLLAGWTVIGWIVAAVWAHTVPSEVETMREEMAEQEEQRAREIAQAAREEAQRHVSVRCPRCSALLRPLASSAVITCGACGHPFTPSAVPPAAPLAHPAPRTPRP